MQYCLLGPRITTTMQGLFPLDMTNVMQGLYLPDMTNVTLRLPLPLHLHLPEDSLLQPVWDYVLRHHQATIRSPLFPVFLSVSTYLFLVSAYTTLDLLAPHWAWLNRRRLHPDRHLAWSSVWRTLGLTTYNHMVFIFPAAVGQWLWRPPVPLPDKAPTLLGFLAGVLGCTVIFDFQYYFWHMLHHRVGWLYRTFHAVHHQYQEPFSLVTQYLSGWELFSVGFWTTANPIILQCHCLTTWAFMVFNIWVSTEDHCGYDFPWAMHNLVPFGLWGGLPKHDAHHQRPSTNYAPFFSHWDWLGGTAYDPPSSLVVGSLKNNKNNKSRMSKNKGT